MKNKIMGEGWIQKVVNSKSKTLIAFCFCFIMGASIFSLPTFKDTGGAIYLFAALFISMFFAIIFWNNRIYRFYIFCLFSFLFGIWRLLITVPNCANQNSVCFYNGQKASVVGTINTEPDIRIDKVYYILSTQEIGGQKVNGNMMLTGRLYPQYNFGEKLSIECSLQGADNQNNTSTFRYDKYLARLGVWSTCFPSRIIIASSSAVAPFFMSKILSVKSMVQNQIDKLYPEPEGSFMAGILYGSRASLPKEISDNFSKTGVTHIIAVSGFNITIIATFLMAIGVAIGLWRKQAYYLVITSLILFTFFTGATASVVRASVMGVLALTAQYWGRMSRIFSAIIFAAAVMLLFNPYVLFWDAGFQLSFLALIGLVYLSPILKKIFKVELWPEKYTFISETLFATLSAIIATLPLILYQFGRLSIVAPIVNILVLWIIPYLMLFGALSLAVSFIIFPLGQILAYLAILGLKYVIMVTSWFGSLSFAALEFKLPLWGAIIMYIFIIISVIKYVKSKSSSID